LPGDNRPTKVGRPSFDFAGTLLLATTLAVYALALTMGSGSFSALKVALLIAVACGVWLFVLSQQKTLSPLIQMTMFRNSSLSAGLAMSSIVSAVIMTTLVLGPFYPRSVLPLTDDHMASKSTGAAGQTGSPAVVQATSEIHLNPEIFSQAMLELGVNGY
jgi:hypothetical protein